MSNPTGINQYTKNGYGRKLSPALLRANVQRRSDAVHWEMQVPGNKQPALVGDIIRRFGTSSSRGKYFDTLPAGKLRQAYKLTTGSKTAASKMVREDIADALARKKK